MKTILPLFYIVLVYCCALCLSQKLNCNRKNDKQIDTLLARVLTFGESGRKFPEVEEEVPAYCNETKALVKKVETYIKKCTKSLSKQLFSVYLFTIKSQMTQLCKKDSKRRREMLGAAKCVNSAKKVFAKCINATVDHMQRIKLVEDSKKVPHLCCEYHEHKLCYSDVGKTVSDCSESHLEIIDKFADSVAGNSLNILCGEYAEQSDKCKGLGSLPKNVKNPSKYKSFFIPAIEVISTLPA